MPERLLCKQCGTRVYGNGADRCPNCDADPRAADEEGLFKISPRVLRAFKKSPRRFTQKHVAACN